MKILPTTLLLHLTIAFPLERPSSHRTNQYQSSSLSSSSSTSLKNVAHIVDTDESSSETLNFVSKFGSQSDPLPAISSEDAVAFFREPTNLSFGESMPSKIVPATPRLVEEWFEAYHKLGLSSTLPDPERDLILCVRTAGIKIPGLTVEWCGHIGTRLMTNIETNLPMLEFVLIKDQLNARGIKPLMWMFKKATKKSSSKSDKEKQKQRYTRFVSRVSLQSAGGDNYVFNCNGVMEMSFAVPSVLRKAMGTDKTKHESRISKLITTQIEKDMAKAVGQWHSTYENWIEVSQCATI